MRDMPLTQEALSLAHQLFRKPIGAHVGDDMREMAAFAHLVQSCQALGAVVLIVRNLGKEALNPAYILVRHMLELAVRLRYLEAHPERLDADGLLTWNRPSLEKMCCELGMSDHYERMYRWLSGKTHALAKSVFAEFSKVAGYREVPDWQSAHVLICAIVYYGMVVDVNTKIFPNLASNFTKLQGGAWEERLKALLEASAFEPPGQ